MFHGNKLNEESNFVVCKKCLEFLFSFLLTLVYGMDMESWECKYYSQIKECKSNEFFQS